MAIRGSLVEQQLLNVEVDSKNKLESKTKPKASLFTLVAMLEGKRCEELQKIVELICAKFPCRLLLVEPSYSSSGWLSALEGRCELVRLSIDQGTQEEQLPHLLYRHLLPDLPLFGLWSLPRRGGSLTYLQQLLLPHLNRLLYLLEEVTTEAIEEALALASHFGQQRQEGDAIDVDWMVQAPWRQGTARLFAQREGLLRTSSRLEITYEGHRPYALQTAPLYYGCWLAMKVEWSLAGLFPKTGIAADGWSLSVEGASTTPLLVRLNPKPEEKSSLLVGRLALVEGDGGLDSSYELRYDEEKGLLWLKMDYLDRCELPSFLPLRNGTKPLLSARKLLYSPPPTEDYLMTLKLIYQLLR